MIPESFSPVEAPIDRIALWNGIETHFQQYTNLKDPSEGEELLIVAYSTMARGRRVSDEDVAKKLMIKPMLLRSIIGQYETMGFMDVLRGASAFLTQAQAASTAEPKAEAASEQVIAITNDGAAATKAQLEQTLAPSSNHDSSTNKADALDSSDEGGMETPESIRIEAARGAAGFKMFLAVTVLLIGGGKSKKEAN